MIIAKKIDYLELIGKYTNPFEALNLVKKEQIDLIFLDIQMPDLNGFSFVKSMKKAPFIVFTTAYKKYALESYDLNALDYLLKPFSFERFFQAIEKVNERISDNLENITITELETSTDFVFINYNSRIIKIQVDDIIFINSDGDYVYINTINHKYIIREKLKNISDKLNPNLFIRIHKSYIVSLNKIDELYGKYN